MTESRSCPDCDAAMKRVAEQAKQIERLTKHLHELKEGLLDMQEQNRKLQQALCRGGES